MLIGASGARIIARDCAGRPATRCSGGSIGIMRCGTFLETTALAQPWKLSALWMGFTGSTAHGALALVEKMAGSEGWGRLALQRELLDKLARAPKRERMQFSQRLFYLSSGLRPPARDRTVNSGNPRRTSINRSRSATRWTWPARARPPRAPFRRDVGWPFSRFRQSSAALSCGSRIGGFWCQRQRGRICQRIQQPVLTSTVPF